MEGSLDTEVVDVNLLEIPDPGRVPKEERVKIIQAFRSLNKRPIGLLVEERFMGYRNAEEALRWANEPIELPAELKMEDRRALDESVFAALGVKDAERRRQLVDNLYTQIIRYHRHIRISEIQKVAQRATTASRGFSIAEMAEDVWNALDESERVTLPAFMEKWHSGPVRLITVPHEPVFQVRDDADMFEPNTILFGNRDGNKIKVAFPSGPHVRLIELLTRYGLAGDLKVPQDPADAETFHSKLVDWLKKVKERFSELAAGRTSDARIRRDIVDALMNRISASQG